MSAEWVAKRVAKADLKRVLKNVVQKTADAGWGANREFKFPQSGGTGEISRRLLPGIREHLRLNKKMRTIDLKKKEIYFADGERVPYELLISTIPLDQLIKNSNAPAVVKGAAAGLEHNSISVVGVGVKARIASSRTWGYFPEQEYPFQRITYFSNYSPENVPARGYYSIIAEINRRGKRGKSPTRLIEETIDGLARAHIIKEAHRSKIASTFFLDRDYAYPIPTLQREHLLKKIFPYLQARGVYSRGRFGAWRYEIGNMDHSILQGIEVVEHILEEKEESVLNSVSESTSPASLRRSHGSARR
jgi:protoporphyrinogen oxidase